MDYNTRAKDIITKLKPSFTKYEGMRKVIRDFPNKLDRQFYLQAQDELAVILDELLDAYGEIRPMAKDAEAISILALKKKYESVPSKERPKVGEISAEVRIENSDVNIAESIVYEKIKSVKNIIQTCRSHIAIITSGGDENEGDK